MSIEIRHLTKHYEENVVFSDLNLLIPDGQISCLMGPSGCGKTTLLRILMGFEKPDSGTVSGVTGPVSAVFQEDRLCDRATVYENIQLVRREKCREKIMELLLQLGIESAADQPVRELSGGMARRTAIARALIADYDLLLLDEPFKGLDEETKKNVMKFVKQEISGKTVLLVTHDPEEAEFFAGNPENIIKL